MCEPATIVTVGSTLLGGYQQYRAGQDAKAAAKFNERELQNQGIRTRNQATERENDLRQKTAQRVSRQRAAAAAQGGNVDAGSNLLIQEDTAEIGEIDALRIRNTADDQVDSLNRQAELTGLQGDSAARAGKIGLASSFLSAAGQFASSPTGKSLSSKWFSKDSAANAGNVVNRAGMSRSLGF